MSRITSKANEAARRRLEDISHHFLSDAAPAAPVAHWQDVPTLALVIGNSVCESALPTLLHACATRKLATLVLHLEATTDEDSNRILLEKIQQQAHIPELCIMTLNSVAPLAWQGCQKLVLVIPATEQAVIAAYLDIKQLSLLRQPPLLGVIMLGATPLPAVRLFDKLNQACQRFLYLPLSYCGHLPDAKDMESTPCEGGDPVLDQLLQRWLQALPSETIL